MIKFDKFEHFLYVSGYYNLELSAYRNYGNKNANIRSHLLEVLPVAISAYLINSMSFYIADDMKALSLIDDRIINLFFAELIDRYKLREVLTCDSEMSNYEIIQSIRNCLAHSNYLFIVDSKTNKELININNHKISGTLDFDTLTGIFGHIHEYRLLLEKIKSHYTDIDEISNLKTNNKSNYDRSLHVIKKMSYSDDYTKSETTHLTHDETCFIKYYIDYYGLNKWIKLDPSKRKYLLNHVVRVLNSGDLCHRLCEKFDAYFLNIIKSSVRKNSPYYKIDEISVDFYSPAMYANSLLKYSFYVFNYLKESSVKEGFSSYLYRDLDVSKINFKNQDRERYVKYVCDSTVEERYNNSCAKEKELEEVIQRANDSIAKIISSSRSDEAKNNAIKGINDYIEKSKVGLEKRRKITRDLEKKMENASYYNYAELFRRLRNSISHGNYKIDYASALKTKNMDNMVINFFDSEYGDSFNVDIRAGDLLDIFSQITENMKKNSSYFQEEKEIIFELLQDTPVEFVKSTYEKLSSNTKITYSPAKTEIVDGKIKKTI